MNESQNILIEERQKEKKFILNSKKCTAVYSKRKQTSDFLGMGLSSEGCITKGHKEHF